MRVVKCKIYAMQSSVVDASYPLIIAEARTTVHMMELGDELPNVNTSCILVFCE